MTKIRVDGKGSEFGQMHRELPPTYTMFDVDRLKARITYDLDLKSQDTAFIEYRTNYDTMQIEFKALFEIRYKDTDFVRNSMKCEIGKAVWAQVQMCQRLGCRYFYVISTDGKQPFEFYELTNYKPVFVGKLNYTESDKKEKVNYFWKNNLKL